MGTLFSAVHPALSERYCPLSVCFNGWVDRYCSYDNFTRLHFQEDILVFNVNMMRAAVAGGWYSLMVQSSFQ